MGEFFNQKGYCEKCKPQYWLPTPVPNDPTPCTKCDSKSLICRGGNDVGPKSGYWRFNASSDIVLQCPNPEVCLGNDEEDEELDLLGKCVNGHTGNLCDSCIKGWAKIGGGNCIDCHATPTYYIQFVGVLIA